MSLKLFFKQVCNLEDYKIDRNFRKSVNEIYKNFLKAEKWAGIEEQTISALYGLNNTHLTGLLKVAFQHQPRHRNQKHQVEVNKPISITPYKFHSLIKRSDIKPNGKLLSDKGIENLKNLFANNPEKPVEIEGYKAVSIPNAQNKNNAYVLYKKLGEGNRAIVYSAQNPHTGTFSGIKVPKHAYGTMVANAQGVLRSQLENEKDILEVLGQFKAYVATNKNNNGYLVMPLFSGVPLNNINHEASCAFIRIKRVISLLEAVHALHQQSVAHHDLTLGNALCDINDDIHLIDYGLSNKIKTSTEGVESDIGLLIEACKKILLLDNINLSADVIKTIKDQLQSMKTNSKEIKLDKAIQFFREIQGHCLELVSRFRNTGFVFTDELITKNGKLNQTILKPLQAMDKVYICSSPSSQLNPAKKAELAKQGIRIAGIIELKSLSERNEVMIAAAKQVESQFDGKEVNTHFYITLSQSIEKTKFKDQIIQPLIVEKGNTKQQYKTEIKKISNLSLNHFIFVIEQLEAELLRVEEKYKQSAATVVKENFTKAPITTNQSKVIAARKQLINTLITELSHLYAHGNLSQQTVLTKLKYLERNMVNPNLIKRFFANFFGKTTEGAKNIHTLRKQLQESEMLFKSTAPTIPSS